MDVQLQKSLQEMLDSVSSANTVSALTLSVYLLLGGCMSLYVRLLYRRFGASASDSDSITRVFPLLTMVTIGVIAVVKTSMALSLGLVGALSIVRFRAAIKEPEELVYLFLCIGVGLSLGAGQPLLALVLVLSATIFIVGMYWTGQGKQQQCLLLTISSDTTEHFTDEDSGVVKILDELAGKYVLQRFDIENGAGQIRVQLSDKSAKDAASLVAKLRQRLPECEFNYVNMSSTL